MRYPPTARLSPNPPHGVRTAEGCEGVTGAITGLDSGRREVAGRPAGALGGADGGLRWARGARFADQGGASLRGHSVVRWVSVADGAVKSGVEWLAVGPGRLNWVSQGQRWGRCEAAGRIRPAREKNRRRRVLVVTTCSPRPVRAVQRARLCAITCIASQAALAAKRPDGMWFSPTPYLRSRMAFSISA